MRAAVWVQESPLGPLLVATSTDGLRLLDLRGPVVTDPPPRRHSASSFPPGRGKRRRGTAGRTGWRGSGAHALDQPVDQVAEPLDAYFAGDLDAVEAVAVDLAGRSPFSVAVLTALRGVGPKSLTSYGRLAAAAGRPGAGRAVGGAVGANPVPIVVPCHRVVAGDGSLGGFGYGPDVKRWLLAHEGHPVDGARPFDLGD